MDFLNNQWTIGIGGSIISGIIVFYFTERIAKRKINKELLENINIANAEVIYALRPLLVAKRMPEQSVITSLLKSTAKKHHVSTNSLLTWIELTDQLTKEVLENSFLSADSKLDYCKMISNMRDSLESDDKKIPDVHLAEVEAQYRLSRRQKVMETSILYTLLATLIPFILFLAKSDSFKSFLIDSDKISKYLALSLTVLGFAFGIVLFFDTNRKNRNSKSDFNKKHKNEGNTKIDEFF